MVLFLLLLIVLIAGALMRARSRVIAAKASESQAVTPSQKPVGLQLCRKPWFNPESPADWKVTANQEPKPFAEVDSPANLLKAQGAEFTPYNRFVIYQQWGPVPDDGSRAYFWLSRQAAQELAEIVASGPAQELILVCTTFEPGAIRAFADALAARRKPENGVVLDTLGLFWYFSGDTAEDSPEILDEAAYAADKLGLNRLSILSGGFPPDAQQRLAAGLKGNTTLKWFGAFSRDEAMTWPDYPMPQIQALISANRAAAAR